MNEFELIGNQGYYQDDQNLISFQIGADDINMSVMDDDQLIHNLNVPILYKVGDYKILIKGKTNRLPDEIQTMVGDNRLLPELIEKQVRILYGKGLFTYKIVYENKKPSREWINQEQRTEWFNSWQKIGIIDTA